MLIGLIVFISLALLILGHEAGHFFTAKFFRMRIDEFGFGFPPRIKAWRPFDSAQGKKGETEYSVNWLPFGGFVKIAGEEEQITNPEKLQSLSPEDKKRYFLFQDAWKRFIVIASGVLVNFVFGWLIISSVFMAGTPPVLVINWVQSGSPAEKAGIEAGDVLKNYPTGDDFIGFVNGHRGKEVTLNILRGNQDITIKAVPRTSTSPDEGALGIQFSEAGIQKQGLFQALWNGLKESIYICWATLVAMYELFKNLFLQGSLLPGVVGPVGIFTVAEKTGQIGMIYLAQLIGFISLNLAVLNLIPFPALDGGRLLLIVLEKLRGSPISIKIQAAINGVGFVILLVLMVTITFRDIVNLF
ncbi:MAG: site-2 protease family protein [Candidatus Liptonbacteria bacterium]|nr:site-2 protease family protein [Candidatus Liptonbacteria bacterium]